MRRQKAFLLGTGVSKSCRKPVYLSGFVHLDPLLLTLVEHFINAALSKSWIEAQPLLHSWSLDERERRGEKERERETAATRLACEEIPEVNKMSFSSPHSLRLCFNPLVTRISCICFFTSSLQLTFLC
jgi:hypothetical protein